MDRTIALGLGLVTLVSFILGIEWLLLGAVLVFIALSFSERLAPTAPAGAGEDFAFQQPVIVQSNMHSAAQSFYTSIINNMVQNTLQKSNFDSQASALSEQTATLEKLFDEQGKRIKHVSHQMDGIGKKMHRGH